MRRTGFGGVLAAVCVGGLLTGCGRGGKVVVEYQPSEEAKPAATTSPPASPTNPPPVAGEPAPAGLSPQDQYEFALWDALRLMAEQKDEAALASLQAAQKLQDTPLVQREIARLQAKLERARAAEQTTRTIQAVLTDG